MHDDIKPENIILKKVESSEEGIYSYKYIDFGGSVSVLSILNNYDAICTGYCDNFTTTYMDRKLFRKINKKLLTDKVNLRQAI